MTSFEELRAAVDAVERSHTAEVQGLVAAVDQARAERDTVQAAYDAHMREAHADPDTAKKIIGMSSPATVWGQRLAEVGPDGIRARRIFAQLNSSGSDQMDLVAAAHEARMMPVYSFKVPNVSSATIGSYDSWVDAMAGHLAGFGLPTVVVFHHEPYGDMTGAQFVAIWRRYLPILQRGLVAVGPFVNGWLLDRRTTDFTSYTAPDLLDAWDFMGIDTYESGTIDAPGEIKPADRVPKLLAWLDAQGHPEKPVGIGEYNGYSGESIAAAGEAFLSCPSLWFACMWNATTGKGHVLTGERLAAFKATKADARVVQ